MQTDFPPGLLLNYNVVRTIELRDSSRAHLYYELTKKNTDTRAFLKVSPFGKNLNTILNRLAGYSHPNLLFPEQVYTTRSNIFIVYPWIDLPNLHQRLVNEPVDSFTYDHFFHFAHALNKALKYLHGELRIIHCDLKPGNIFWEDKQPINEVVIKIGDFDSCTEFVEASEKRTIRPAFERFTINYASPEMANPRISITPACDYWAFGMIIYECITRATPFQVSNRDEILSRLTGDWVPDFNLIRDERVRALISGLCQRDPELRWSHGELDRWLENDAEIILQGLNSTGQENAAETPFELNGRLIYSARGLAEAVLLRQGTDFFENGELISWIKTSLSGGTDIIRMMNDVKTREGLNPEMGKLEVAFALWKDIPPVWLGTPLKEDSVLQAVSGARKEDENSVSWLRSLLGNEELFRFFGERGVAGLASLKETFIDLEREYKKSWRQIIDAGAPASARDEPEGTPEIFTLVELSLDQTAFAQFKEQTKDLFAPKTLLLRASWFYCFGVSDELSLPKLFILHQLQTYAMLEQFSVGKAQSLSDLAENNLENQVIFHEAQEALLNNVAVQKGATITHQTNGGTIQFGDRPHSFFYAVQTRVNRLTMRFLRGVLRPFSGILPRFVRLGLEIGEPRPDDFLEYDAYFMPLVPVTKRNDIFETPSLILTRLSWSAGQGSRVKLIVKSQSPKDTMMVLRDLPVHGHLVLVLWRSCSIKLVERTGFFRIRRSQKTIVTMKDPDLWVRKATEYLIPPGDLITPSFWLKPVKEKKISIANLRPVTRHIVEAEAYRHSFRYQLNQGMTYTRKRYREIIRKTK